ncbi:UNVERIFIED_CONTAM: hypothetical protein Sradi_6004700 [Sesamum radiatum]|uniref:Uncharacterized protein n=1 Tax=Sesamum radiatum TaxID=300843 RepID=A0AAW2KHY3_SESRA
MSCIFSTGLCTLPAITLQTIRAFLKDGLPSNTWIESNALPLVEAVNTPMPSLSSFLVENPYLRIRQTRHLSDVQRLESPSCLESTLRLSRGISAVRSRRLSNVDVSWEFAGFDFH